MQLAIFKGFGPHERTGFEAGLVFFNPWFFIANKIFNGLQAHAQGSRNLHPPIGWRKAHIEVFNRLKGNVDLNTMKNFLLHRGTTFLQAVFVPLS